MTKTPIQAAVENIGSQGATAQAIGVTQPLVWQWCNGKRPVAAHHCVAIEQATGGEVTRYDLRPDVFGEAPAQQVDQQKTAA
jgi:DNA-binding transcriptional regulator YdaS (Cro superfamily)